MPVLIISYETKSDSFDYSKLHEFLRDYSLCSQILESTWLVRSAEKTSDIRDQIEALVHPSDSIFVGRLDGRWDTQNIELEFESSAQ